MNATSAQATATPRWALITGASSGIGYEFGKLFAKDQINTVLVARNETRLRQVGDELQRDYGISVVIAPLDLSQADAAEKLLQTIQQQDLSIDYLVNNAGIGFYGPFADSDPAANAGMINLNIAALVQLTRLFLPGMIKQGRGRILNVASLTAYQPGGPGAAVYYASKSFVLAPNRGLAVELKGSGVTTTALCPGAMRTAFETKGGFSRTRLYRFLASDPQSNAEAGYRAMHKGKPAVVPGWLSKILAIGGELPPRRFALWVNKILLTS
ncbi:MAG: SDR family NAD(P)-dependent oxidoreductase [Gammaproteobacteria bacterium]